MSKKFSLSALCIGAMVLILVACGQESSSFDSSTAISKTSDVHPDYAVPEEVTDLEERSDAIVRIQPSGNVNVAEVNDIKDEIGDTTHEVEITQVFEGDFEVGDTIIVAEAFFLQEGEYVQLEGYTPLSTDREYIVFL